MSETAGSEESQLCSIDSNTSSLEFMLLPHPGTNTSFGCETNFHDFRLSLPGCANGLSLDELNSRLQALNVENVELKEIISRLNHCLAEQCELHKREQAQVASIQLQLDEDKSHIGRILEEVERYKELEKDLNARQYNMEEVLQNKLHEIERLHRLNRQIEDELVELRLKTCQNVILTESKPLSSLGPTLCDISMPQTLQSTNVVAEDNHGFVIVGSSPREEPGPSTYCGSDLDSNVALHLEAEHPVSVNFQNELKTSQDVEHKDDMEHKAITLERTTEPSLNHQKYEQEGCVEGHEDQCTLSVNSENFLVNIPSSHQSLIKQLECEIICLRKNLQQEQDKCSVLSLDIAALHKQNVELQFSKIFCKREIATKENEIQDLQKRLEELQQLAELNAVQLKIYKSDFEDERRARENINDEKLKLLTRVHQLESNQDGHNSQQKPSITHNRQLAAASSLLQTGSFVEKSTGKMTATTGSRTPKSSSESTTFPFECPVCHFRYKTLQSLNNHLERCLNDPQSRAS